MKEKSNIRNIYKLNGKVPIHASIPFGLQHIFAMFVANITPIVIISNVAYVNGTPMSSDIALLLIQNSMFVAGIASLIQILGVWKIGSRLPIIMGISFTFLAAMIPAAMRDYNYVMGAVIVGGIIEGTLGLTYKYWKKIISPIVAACVVCGIGLSLFTIGTVSFGGGDVNMQDFGSMKYWIVGSITLTTCIVWLCATKGFLRSISILIGLIVGYTVSIFFGMVDFSKIFTKDLISIPKIMPTGFPKFDMSIILSVVIIYLVSATETVGDSSAVCTGGLNRDIEEKELSGALMCDGYASTIAGLFGCTPITSFSQNVGLVNITKVINRYVVATGAVILVIVSFFPPLAGFFQTIPQPVLGGCTIMMFGQILISGMKMINKTGFTIRNITIASLSLCIGGGFTATTKIFQFMPDIVKNIFADNIVADVFVIAVLLNLLLPKDMEDIEMVEEY